MAYNLIITEHADALIDKLVGYLYRKLHHPEAALHLMDGLDAIYDRLEANPLQFPESTDEVLSGKGYREALLMDMDYRIIFRIEEQSVYIVGVYHALEDYGKKVP